MIISGFALQDCFKSPVGIQCVFNRSHCCRGEHRPLGAHSGVSWDVDGVASGVVFGSQSQVSDNCSAVLFHQDVLGFYISVSNRWFS